MIFDDYMALLDFFFLFIYKVETTYVLFTRRATSVLVSTTRKKKTQGQTTSSESQVYSFLYQPFTSTENHVFWEVVYILETGNPLLILNRGI